MSKKLFIKGVSYSYLRQILQLATGLLTLPLLLNHLGALYYGIFVLVLGLSEYLHSIAFGIPAALVTLVAKNGNEDEKHEILYKSVKLLVFISTTTLIIFLFSIYINDNWIISLLGNIQPENASTTKILFILFVLGTLFRLPLSLYISFFRGMNLTHLFETYQMLFTITNFLVVLVVYYLDLNIVQLVSMLLGVQLVINIIALLHVYIKYDYLGRAIRSSHNIEYADILKSGYAFFQIGLAVSVIWATDNLVISHFLSPEYVAPYSIAFKIFMYTFMFSAIINGVLGPMYGEALTHQNWELINIYAKLVQKLLPILGVLVWFFLLLFGKEVILFWTQNDESFGGYFLIFSFGLYGYVVSFANSYTTVINSLNYANLSLKIVWVEAILNLLLSIVLVNFFGIAGVALATALASFFVPFLLFPRLIKKVTNEKIVYDFSYTKKQFIFLVLPLVTIIMFALDFYFLWKVLLLFVVTIVLLSFSWILLQKNDQELIINFVKKRK